MQIVKSNVAILNPRIKLQLIVFVLLISFGSNVHAQEEALQKKTLTGYLGGLLGGNFPVESNSTLRPAAGVTVGANLVDHFGFGLLATYFGQKTTGKFLGLPTGTSTGTLFIAGQAHYVFNGFHLGGEVGPAFSFWSSNVSTMQASSSKSFVLFGPEAGYDFVIAKHFSVGAELHYLISSEKSAAQNLQAFAAFKLWQ